MGLQKLQKIYFLSLRPSFFRKQILRELYEQSETLDKFCYNYFHQTDLQMKKDKKVILLLDFILRIEHVDYNNIIQTMITVFNNIGQYSIDYTEAPNHYDIDSDGFHLCIKRHQTQSKIILYYNHERVYEYTYVYNQIQQDMEEETSSISMSE